MKKSLLLTSLLTTILAACGAGKSSGNSNNIITPPVYNGQFAESYSVTLSNNAILHTSNNFILPNTNQSSNTGFSISNLPQGNSTTVNFTISSAKESNLPTITPSSCNFVGNSQNESGCTISINQNNAPVGNYSITPNYNGTNLTPITFSYQQQLTSSSSINLNGSWLITGPDEDLDTCTLIFLNEVQTATISGNTINFYINGQLSDTAGDQENPITIPYQSNILSMSYIPNGVWIATGYDPKCELYVTHVWYKIKN